MRPLAGTARISLQGYVAYLLNTWDIEPGSPPDWSVFTLRIELTCGSPFGRLLPSCISVLSFCRLYFGGISIFMIARSIDLAPLPSDNKSTMGPGFAVVGNPGSSSDVAQTKVLLPRLFGDSDRFIVRLRSVAIYRLFNQRHQSHSRRQRLLEKHDVVRHHYRRQSRPCFFERPRGRCRHRLAAPRSARGATQVRSRPEGSHLWYHPPSRPARHWQQPLAQLVKLHSWGAAGVHAVASGG